MSKKTTGIKQYRCKKCDAPYPLGADDVIATCPYCGYTFTIDGSEIKHLILPNKLNEKSAHSTVMQWLEFAAKKTVGKGVVKTIELEKPRLQWFPVFRVEGDYESFHFGYKQEGSGDSRKYRRIENRDSGRCIEWVIARRHAATFGIDEFVLSLEDTPTQSFTIDKTDNAPVLNSEIDDTDSIRRAKRNRKDRDRVELLEKMSKLLDHSFEIIPESSVYTHAPYWLVRYTYQKGTFRVAVSGATGKVLLGELPVTKRYRVKKWFISVFMLIFGSLFFQVLPYVLYIFFQGSSSGDAGDAWLIPIGILVLGVFLWVGSVITIGGSLKYEIQVNAKGEECRDPFSIDGAIKRIGGK
ncbi:MAG: hypothetical protein JW779_11565 [Candidatus Thorarchaeota archaeon]|nr:hypothetical protein [Candidatus Thorarchaeota archaeon]